MITKNFKSMMSLILQSNGASGVSQLPIKVTTYLNEEKYLVPKFSNAFPGVVENSVTFYTSSSGIVIGSGNDAPTENDINLKNQITSGLSASSPSVSFGSESGNPYKCFTFTLTNNTSSDIIIQEVGYKSGLNCANSIGGSIVNGLCLLDRTVLENPLTVPANGTAVLKYTLKTIINTPAVQ